MLQLSENAKKEWQTYIDFYVNKLNTPEHLYYVNNFISYVKAYGLNSQDGKIALMNLITSIANTFNVNISQVYLTNNSTALGTYLPANRGVIINENYRNITGLLITIYHEMRHALQMQSLMYGDGEFLKALNYDIVNYKMPDSTLVGNADYFSNLSEEDAVLFSLGAVQMVLQGVTNEYDRSIMKQDFEVARQESLNSIATSEEFKQVSDQATKNYIEEYGAALSYIFKGKEPQIEKSTKLFKLLDYLKTKYANYEKIIRSDGTISAGILKYIFDNCTLEELARNIDDPNISILRNMENYNYLYATGTYADSKMKGLYFGSRFDQLKIYVNEARDLLNIYKIPYDKNDQGRMFSTFMNISYDLAANLFERQCKGKFMQGDGKLANMLVSMQSYKMLDRERTIKHMIERYGMRKITSWYTKRFESQEYRRQTQYPSLAAVDILGYRLGEFEKVSREMNNTNGPQKYTFKSVFGKGSSFFHPAEPSQT